jgi:hypothetical protein
MKTNFIKKTVLLAVIAIIVVMSSSFCTKEKASNYTNKILQDSPGYYFVTAWKNNEKTAVISNIVYVTCKHGNHVTDLEIAFDSWYDKNYGNPGVEGSSINAYTYSTKSEAIKGRNEIIAKYEGNNTKTTFVNYFFLNCN